MGENVKQKVLMYGRSSGVNQSWVDGGQGGGEQSETPLGSARSRIMRRTCVSWPSTTALLETSNQKAPLISGRKASVPAAGLPVVGPSRSSWERSNNGVCRFARGVQGAPQRRRSALLAHELVETRGKLLEESVALLKQGIPTVLGGLLEALELGTGLITGLAQLG